MVPVRWVHFRILVVTSSCDHVLFDIGIPWVRSCLVIAQFNLCMFEKELIKHSELSGKHNLGNTFAAFNKKLAQHCSIYKRQIKAIKELPKIFLFKI